MNRFIKGRKIYDKNIVIDAEITENDNNMYNNKKNSLNGNNNVNIVFVIILSVLLSLVSGFGGAYLVIASNTGNASSDGGIVISNLELNEPSSIADAVEKVYDAVGVVEVYSDGSLTATGTGFIYKIEDKKAYLMTNNHVISSGGDIKVLFPNGSLISASVVGSDTYSDIAVLSIEEIDGVASAVIGDSDKSSVGDTVFTVGSPEGSDYAGTVTKGILSGKDRVVEVALANSSSYDYYMDVIQTDAAINPGNSGGPLCNTNGEVIGITNMKLVDNTVEGMGFAIPIEEAMKVAEVLESDGKIVRPYVGIEMLELTNEFNLWRAGILIPNGVDGGIAVYNVVDDSPADVAGLKKGDIIISLGGKDINNLADFRYALYKFEPGDEVDVTYVRNNDEVTIKMVLGTSE